MYNNKTVIFTDFDGVLFDTVKEAFLISRKAYKGISTFDEIEKKEYKNFCKLRYLITTSWQFLYVWKMIDTNQLESNVYTEFITNATPSEYMDFENKYVEIRKDLIDNHFDFWDSLDSPFHFFFELMQIAKSKKVIILTSKNKLAINKKLLKFNFSNIEVYGKEDLVIWETKADFIQNFISKNNFKSCIFIEDSVQNIQDCKKYSFITPLLVNWGYIPPTSQGVSEQEVLSILKEAL